MIDHVSIPVSDLRASAAFYEAALAPLRLIRLVDRERTVGFGKRYPEFWLNLRDGLSPAPEGSGAHVALRAHDKAAVIAFHRAALAHDAACDGPPGDRPAAMTTYFGAFIRDPDGNRIEALTFPRPD